MKNIQGIFSNKTNEICLASFPSELERFLVTAYFSKRFSCALFKKAL
jgi:hypothetical protein